MGFNSSVAMPCRNMELYCLRRQNRRYLCQPCTLADACMHCGMEQACLVHACNAAAVCWHVFTQTKVMMHCFELSRASHQSSAGCLLTACSFPIQQASQAQPPAIPPLHPLLHRLNRRFASAGTEPRVLPRQALHRQQQEAQLL